MTESHAPYSNVLGGSVLPPPIEAVADQRTAAVAAAWYRRPRAARIAWADPRWQAAWTAVAAAWRAEDYGGLLAAFDDLDRLAEV